MAKNKLTDLNDHLFMALERLDNDDLKGDELRDEITKSRAVVDVGKQIVSNGRLVLEAAKLAADNFGRDMKIPPMLHGKDQ